MREERQMRIASSKFETRETGEDLYIEGYFSVFNSVYQMWDGATESVDPHAFDNTINDDIRCLINHDSGLVLGRTKAGTLELKSAAIPRVCLLPLTPPTAALCAGHL